MTTSNDFGHKQYVKRKKCVSVRFIVWFDYLSNFHSSKIPPNTTFTILLISESFVRNSLNHLPETKAAGLERIGEYFLKIAATAISSALTKIYNLSINLIWLVFLTCGKLQRFHLFSNRVHYLTVPTFALSQFWPLSLIYLNAMFIILFIAS
jgi:hypothetical protein